MKCQNCSELINGTLSSCPYCGCQLKKYGKKEDKVLENELLDWTLVEKKKNTCQNNSDLNLHKNKIQQILIVRIFLRIFNKKTLKKISFPVGLFILYLGLLYMILSVQSEELFIFSCILIIFGILVIIISWLTKRIIHE